MADEGDWKSIAAIDKAACRHLTTAVKETPTPTHYTDKILVPTYVRTIEGGNMHAWEIISSVYSR